MVILPLFIPVSQPLGREPHLPCAGRLYQAIRRTAAPSPSFHRSADLPVRRPATCSFSLSGYAGQTITLKFTGSEDYELQTSFVIDDTAVNVS